MKNLKSLKYIVLVLAASTVISCYDEDTFGNPIYQERCSDGIQNGDETGIDCGGSECEPCSLEDEFAGTYRQVDQMGRPGINMLLNVAGRKDSLNITLPMHMRDRFKNYFEDQIKVLDTSYTTNILGLNAEQMASILAEDVLWVAAEGPTYYYQDNFIFTGRALGEDVMDANLLLIFGGPDGTKNNEAPLLIRDGVPANDAPFLDSFPYLAPPF